ncbi:MAG: hypothetical protein AABX55_02395 [Nanoarchaeota archaeon]|mgnify:CR=1 FL=1
MKKLNKKGDFAFEQIGKIILILAFLIILILIAFLFRDKLLVVLENLKDVVRFG